MFFHKHLLPLVLFCTHSALGQEHNNQSPVIVEVFEIRGDGTELNSQQLPKKYPLHNACQQKNATDVRQLLEAKADPNHRDSMQQLPLDYAANSNMPECAPIVELLLAAKANPDPLADPLLHTATSLRNRSLAQMLIAAKGNVNQQDRYGNTPAHIAVSENSSSVLALLIENKADLSLRNKNKETVLQHMFNRDNRAPLSKPILSLLHKNNFDVTSTRRHDDRCTRDRGIDTSKLAQSSPMYQQWHEFNYGTQQPCQRCAQNKQIEEVKAQDMMKE